jgi:hypothetical protein
MTIVAMALMLALAGPVFAQEEPLPEGVSLDYLAFATADDVPAEANQLVLFRMLLAPGAVFRITPEQEGVALTEVERGVLTTTVDGPVQIARARAEPGVEETIAGGKRSRSTAEILPFAVLDSAEISETKDQRRFLSSYWRPWSWRRYRARRPSRRLPRPTTTQPCPSPRVSPFSSSPRARLPTSRTAPSSPFPASATTRA